MDVNENDQEMKEWSDSEIDFGAILDDIDSSELTTTNTNTTSRSNGPSSSFTAPEEIDNGPFVQFKSSVGVHNDDLAEKLLNDVFDFDSSITILMGDGSTQTLKHGVILEQSPFFRRHVLNNMGERKPVNLTEFDSSAVQSLIRYLFTGKLNISKSNVQKLLVTADKFQLFDVKRKCIQVIQDSLDNHNCFDVRKFVKSFGIRSLLKAANAFIAKDLLRFTTSQSFLDFGSDDILELLNSCPSGSIPSSTVFSAILAWVQHDVTNRESHLPQLMRYLSLDDLFETAPELLEVPFGRDGLLARNNECLFNYAEAWKRKASKPHPQQDSTSGKRKRVQATNNGTHPATGTSDNSRKKKKSKSSEKKKSKSSDNSTKKKKSKSKDAQNTKAVRADTSSISDSVLTSVAVAASPKPGGHELPKNQFARKSRRRSSSSSGSSDSSSDSVVALSVANPCLDHGVQTKETAHKSTTQRYRIPRPPLPSSQNQQIYLLNGQNYDLVNNRLLPNPNKVLVNRPDTTQTQSKLWPLVQPSTPTPGAKVKLVARKST